MGNPAKLLQRVSAICLALPEATRETSASHATFRVRKKVFAYFLDNHHDDGICSVCCRLPLGQHEDLAQHDPQRFYLPAYIGARGWLGIRLDRGPPDWNAVAGYIALSFSLAAPKTVAARHSLLQRNKR
jgi:hypothetical protein